MNASSEDIKDMILAIPNIGLVFGINFFIGKEPAKPNDTVVIFDTTNPGPQKVLDNALYEYPSVQVRVRNTDYKQGWDLIHKIMLSLHGRGHETWGGSIYEVIYCSSGPAMLDWDDDQRVRFIVNFN